MNPKIGAINANEILITKLLKERTVALLSEVEFIFIRFLKLGVIIPLIKYINTIKIKLKEKLNDRKNFKGLLTDRRGDLVILEDDQVFEIPMDSIDICRIVPQFN